MSKSSTSPEITTDARTTPTPTEPPVLEMCENVTVMRFRAFEGASQTPAQKTTENEAEIQKILGYINNAEKTYSIYNGKE